MRVAVYLLILFVFIFQFQPLASQASETLETTGDILRFVIPATAFGMTFGFRDKKGRGQFYWSYGSTLAITYLLKAVVDKDRPNNLDSKSFPSGHTSESFAGASFIQRRYGWKYGVPAYLAASLVGWSRIESENHFVEDVLAGAAIGILLTYIFTKPYSDDIHLVPIAKPNVCGLAIQGRW